MRDGKQHGWGTATFADGAKYIGEFRDGKHHGQGAYAFADGSEHVGEWRDGLPNGQGTETSADGSIKEGVFKDGEFQYARKGPSTVKGSIDGKGVLCILDGERKWGHHLLGFVFNSAKVHLHTIKQVWHPAIGTQDIKRVLGIILQLTATWLSGVLTVLTMDS